MKTALVLPVLLLLGSFCSLEAGHILFLVSTAKHNNPGWSRPLLDALHAKGHHLTVFSTEPNPNPKKEVEGLVYFHLPNNYDVMGKHFIDNESKEYQQMVALKQLLVWYEVLLGSCRSIMDSDTMQSLKLEVASYTAQEFDLIITDITQGADCLLPLKYERGKQDTTPVLGLSAGKLTPDLINLLRAENTISAARTPHHLSQVPRNMGFWNRLHNHLMYLGEPIINSLIVRPVLQKIVPSGEVFPNPQLVLLNTHPVLDYVQNLPPGVIEVGGLHIKDEVNRLPTYIEKFTEKFIHGIVYINLPYIESIRGIPAVADMIKSNPNSGFIWNVQELALLPAEMPNVLTLHVDQALQQDILAQSFVKGFLHHGDSFSVQEAVHNGVPMIVLPLHLEQLNTAQRISERSLGVLVPINKLHIVTYLSWALQQILNVNRYTDAMYQAKLKFRSRPQSALELAVWHAEQMMAEPRFFKYLAQPQLNDQNFFVTYSLDVLAVPLIFALLFVFNVVYLILGVIKGRNKKQEPVKKHRKKTKKVAETQEPLNKTLLEKSLVEDLKEEIIEGEIELLNKRKEENPIQEEQAVQIKEEASLPIQAEKNLQDKKQD